VRKLKKAIIITSVAILCLVVLVKSGVLDSLVIFLLVGQIPGTNFTIPSTLMLLVIVSIIWLLLFRFTAVEALNSASLKRSAKHKVAQRKKRMPKRRFEQV
jgi:uncharacterized membrane protein